LRKRVRGEGGDAEYGGTVKGEGGAGGGGGGGGNGGNTISGAARVTMRAAAVAALARML